MLSAQASQFKLDEQGQIFYQEQASNPLPGVVVAQIQRGDSVLTPSVSLIDSAALKDLDQAEALAFLQNWLTGHIAEVLEPLVALHGDEALSGPVKELAEAVYEALGVVPREKVQGFIDQLDADTRRIVRSKRIKLGPILVFQPDLNKPAAVRLRAVLWSLYHEKDLPAPVPNDGVVSFKVEAEQVDKDFQQVIGYPVYGPRAVRIDMLDRVICDVYDRAEGGKFQAQHKWAEWLGTSIEDLYAVLTAMGHSLVYDPAPEQEAAKLKAQEEKEAAKTEDAPAEEVADSTDKAEDEKKPAEQEKPELATFRLKKGKASEKKAPFSKKPFVKGKGKPDHKKDKKAYQGKRNKQTHKEPKVMSAEAKVNPEDNPFAVLQQLKVKGDAN